MPGSLRRPAVQEFAIECGEQTKLLDKGERAERCRTVRDLDHATSSEQKCEQYRKARECDRRHGENRFGVGKKSQRGCEHQPRDGFEQAIWAE
jgi:hypothetical protein